MGDISTWNPVDNSNTTAPPDGWPEGMAPSAVNNSARAMMGAVRRWYDTVTAQLASLTSSLANYLPLTGGTLTGALSAPQYNVGSVIFAAHSSGDGGNYIYDGGGVVALQLYPAASVYLGNSHQFRNDASFATFTIDVSGNATAVGTVTASGLHTTGNVQADGIVHANGDVQANGTVTAAQLTSTGNINAAGTVTGTSFIGNVSVPASGPVTTGGTVTGGQLTSTGSINATYNVNAGGNVTGYNLLASSGGVYLSGNLAFTGNTPGQFDMYTPSGDLAIALLGSPIYENTHYNNFHRFVNSGRDFTYVTFGVAGTFNQSGTWGTLSDASLKDDVAPYERGLEAILELSPISFRYLAGTPFADPERTLRYGLVAQDVAGIIPEMVGETTLETGGAVGTVFPGHLVFVLVNAAKELATQNAALAARITALEENHV